MRALPGGFSKYGKCDVCKKGSGAYFIKKIKNDAVIGCKKCIKGKT